MFLTQRRERSDRLVPLVLGCVGIDRGVFEILAGRINKRDFNARAQAGVQPHCDLITCGRREKDGFHILREHANRLFFGTVTQLPH